VQVVLDYARQIGLDRVVITHPNYQVLEFTLQDCRRFVDQGAYLEWCYLPLTPHWMLRSPEAWGLVEIAAAIRELGADRCLLSSDLGQLHNAPPTEGLREFIQALREEGVADKDLETMTKVTPARLLGLD
jgi:predicted metal-dependent phosphotriesterase family hydrolase